MSSSFPTVPTPPMSKPVRDALYAVYAYLCALSVVVAAGLAVVPGWELPAWYLAITAGLNAFGVVFGFTAKNNIEPGGGRRIKPTSYPRAEDEAFNRENG